MPPLIGLSLLPGARTSWSGRHEIFVSPSHLVSTKNVAVSLLFFTSIVAACRPEVARASVRRMSFFMTGSLCSVGEFFRLLFVYLIEALHGSLRKGKSMSGQD